MTQLQIAFRIAESEIGVREIKGVKHSERILEYQKATTLRAVTDEVPWCAAFVNWCLIVAGMVMDNPIMINQLRLGGYPGDSVHHFYESAKAKSALFTPEELEDALIASPVMPTKSSLARHFLSWGASTKDPVAGDLVVLKRGDNPLSGHVGFFVSHGLISVKVLGGNQDDSVCIRDMASLRVLDFRTL